MNSSFFGFFAHAGFLEGLERRGLRPTQLAGASAGALTGAFYAAGYPASEIVRIVQDPEIADVFREGPGGILRMIGTALNRRQQSGALNGRRALAMLKDRLGERRRIEELRDPTFQLSVANLSRSTSEVISAGPLAEFVLASCAVPGMFRAQRIDNVDYWDGGVADPVPFEHWIGPGGPRRILVHLVVNAEDVQARRNPHPSFYEGLGRCHQIISDEVFRLKLELARQHGQSVQIVRTLAPRPGPKKLHLGARCIELGRRSAAAVQFE